MSKEQYIPRNSHQQLSTNTENEIKITDSLPSGTLVFNMGEESTPLIDNKQREGEDLSCTPSCFIT